MWWVLLRELAGWCVEASDTQSQGHRLIRCMSITRMFEFPEVNVEDFEAPSVFHFSSAVVLQETFLVELAPLYNAFNISGPNWEVSVVCWRALPVFKAPWIANNQLIIVCRYCLLGLASCGVLGFHHQMCHGLVLGCKECLKHCN